MTFSSVIHAPQNGTQRIEHTPVLWRAEVTYGQASIEELEYYSSLAQQQLTQLGQQFVNNELKQQQGQGQQRLRRQAVGS
jgi:hypothetical protein